MKTVDTMATDTEADVALPATASVPPVPGTAAISRREIQVIFVYFAMLTLLLGLGGGLAGLPITFYLKDKLKLGPQQMALFGALTAAPAYIGFLFGFLRDRWRPFGKGDRGYLLLTAPATALCYLLLAFLPLTYGTILWVSLLSGVIGGLMGAAISGLTASVAQRRQMTGRLTALGAFVGFIPSTLASLGSGWLTMHMPPQTTFLLCAALMLAVGLLGLWRPGAVFDGEPEAASREAGEPLRVSIRRFLSHRPLWPAVLFFLLWQVMPGWGTPLLYYMTDTLKINPEQLGFVNAFSPVSTAIMSLFYMALCRRTALRRLLWVGIGISVLTSPAALLIQGVTSAVIIKSVAVLSWAIGGFALSDLLLRSYPRGLEGTGSMLLGGVAAGAYYLSDILGSYLYMHGGFGLAMGVSTLATLLMLPALLLVPRSLIATREGESAASSSAPESSGTRLAVPELGS